VPLVKQMPWYLHAICLVEIRCAWEDHQRFSQQCVWDDNIITFHVLPQKAQAGPCCCCTVLSLSASCDAAQSVTSKLPFNVSSALRLNVALYVNLQEAHKSLILVKGQTKNCGKELVDNIKYDEEVFILLPMFRENKPFGACKSEQQCITLLLLPLLLSRFKCIVLCQPLQHQPTLSGRNLF